MTLKKGLKEAMKNKTVNINYERRLIPKKFGKGYKEKLVKTGKTVVKTKAKGNSELDVIAGMKGSDRVKALKNRNINRTIQSLNIGTQTLGGITSLTKNLSNATKYSGTSSEQQNINGGMTTAKDSREDEDQMYVLPYGDDIA